MVTYHDLSRAVFVYQHRDTGEIKAFYLDGAHAMTGNEAWHHVGTLEPRAWIESHWRHAMTAPELLVALQIVLGKDACGALVLPQADRERIEGAIAKATGGQQ